MSAVEVASAAPGEPTAPASTETISTPWAAVRVRSPVDASVFEQLRPFASRGGGSTDAGPPVVATVRVGRLGECGVVGPEGSAGEPLVLHQGHRGSICRRRSDHLVFNHSRGVHYHVEAGSPPTVTCCVAEGRAEVDVLQIVRGILVGAGLRRLVPLHGAVVATASGDGVLLAGGKYTGKTSFTLGLLTLPESAGAALVCNDKALLDLETLRVYGLPYAITMHEGTLGMLPELAGLSRRRESGKSLFWPAEVAAALGFRLFPSVVLREQWWCSLDLHRLGTVMRSAPPPSESPSALAGFSSNLLPVWLLELLGDWAPRAPIDAVDVPASRLEGNPWRSWLPRPIG